MTRRHAKKASVVLQKARSDLLAKRKRLKQVVLIACCAIGTCKRIYIVAVMEQQVVYVSKAPRAKKCIQKARTKRDHVCPRSGSLKRRRSQSP